ncbi:MAG: TRAP transporter small permease subunit [Pseudorhodoplanes sp.]
MRIFLALSRAIDAFNAILGRWVSWLILVVVLVSAANATTRKLFDLSSNAWLELQWVLFSVVFLLCAPWTLLSNEHIRIDIVNDMLPRWARNWIDLLGGLLFLLPLTVVMILTSGPFFLKSYEINEQSMNAGGLPQWPAKLLVLVGFSLLFLQGVSELIKRVAVMAGIIPDPHEKRQDPVQVEVEHLIEAVESTKRDAR